MPNAPTSGGGIELHRAMEHERAAAIFHLLIRLRQYPTARVTIETYEDLTITCSDGAGGELVEDVQCKKIEDPKQSSVSIGLDDWWSAQLTKGDLKKWLETARRGDSPTGRLAKDPNRRFTLLVYAEPAKSLGRYMPPGVVAGGFTRSPATTDYFPLDFAFAGDPDPGSSSGTPSVRRKIRLVPLGPPQAHTWAEILLHKLYNVMGAKTPDAFRALEYLFYDHITRRPEERTFTLSDVETTIRPFRLGSGKWLDIRALMAAERQRPATTDSLDMPFVAWSDFDEGRFIQTDMIPAGAEAIARHGFIVIAGNNGCGKTVLCKYIARTYLALNPGAHCLYLQAMPGADLRDELEIFQSQLSRRVLFIIDDAQFAEEAVATIAQAYLNHRLTTSLAAKLVIATTETSYSPSQRDGRTNPLDEAHHLRFPFLNSETMRRYLAAYRAYRPCQVTVADSSIVSLAGGDNEQVNMAVALVLAHAADWQVVQANRPLSLEGERARTAIAKWLASSLQLSPAEFGEQVSPVFTVCSFGLSVGPHFSEFTERLIAAGFLVDEDSGATPLLRMRPEYSALAWIVSRQNLRLHNQIFKRYAELHHAQSAQLAESLSSDDTGRRTLLFLLERHLDLFIPAADTRSIDLTALATIIRAARRVRPSSASEFIRLCFRHGDEAQVRVIALRGSVETALRSDVRPLTAFLSAIYRADPIFAGNFATKLIDDDKDLYRLIGIVRDSPSNLEDTMLFLAAAKYCDIRFGTKLAPEFARTREYEEKWREVAASDNPVAVVRVLGALQAVNRRLFIRAREAYLTEEIISRWIHKLQNVAPFVDLLSIVRRMSPRTASRALDLLAARHKGWLASLIGTAAGINESSLGLASIARIDRRMATKLARENFDRLSMQVASENAYNSLGAGLGRIQKMTTSSLATSLAMHMPVASIAENMQHERSRFVSLGRTLDRIADIAPVMAAEVAGRLDYADLYGKVSQHSLMNFSHLTRGLHVALSFDKRSELLAYIWGNPDLASVLHRSLFQERALHQIADALSSLASAELSTSEIFQLFGCDETAFRDFVRRRMEEQGPRSYSDVEVANFLFALALLDPAYSAEALVSYIDGSEIVYHESEPVLQSDDVLPKPGGSKPSITEKLAKRFQGRKTRSYTRRVDLAGAGALLQISSAIDDEAAKKLLTIRLPEFSSAIADKNLGRHSVFLLGLHNVSRAACLQFIREVYTPERAESLVEMAQNPRELIQFLYAVQLVSIGECRRIGSALMRGDADNLRDYLEAEVDLSELSRWIMTLGFIGELGSLDVKGLIAECVEYDTRLWALIDSAQAMIVVGMPDAAAMLTAKILNNVDQIRGIRKLSHCIQLWLKADYISRELNQPGLIARLTGAMLPRALELIGRENDRLCAAFAVGLWLDCGLASSNQQDQLELYRAYQLKRARLVDLPAVRTVMAASMMRAAEDDIAVLVSKINLSAQPLWVSGLLQVALDGYVGTGLPVATGTQAVDPNQNNLKYGLSCYAQRRRRGSVSEGEETELGLRQGDESSSAIRPLLRPDFAARSLRHKPFYTWVYLRRTILALNYLDWDHEVYRANSGATFRTRWSPNPEPILSAAE